MNRTTVKARLRNWMLLLRGLCFAGTRFRCPCCGWSVRGFMERHGWAVRNEDGYCPRCNSKARHRRIWLYLRERTDFFSAAARTLDVGPSPSFTTLMRSQRNVDYVSVALEATMPYVSVVGNANALPFADRTFDGLICQHVLEHIDDDRGAIAEIHRVVKPGGWALISVPIRLDAPTHEDPSVTDPAERQRLFGEEGHVRMYGRDFEQRLTAAAFTVTLDSAALLSARECARYGLRRDEHLFLCRRPASN